VLRGILFGVALVAAPAHQGGGHIASNPHQAAHQNDHSASSASQSEARAPLIIEVEPSAREVERAAQQEAAHGKILGLQPDGWVAIFTLSLTVSTILLWLDTRKSANAALKAANVAEDALTVLERPFLFLTIDSARGAYDPAVLAANGKTQPGVWYKWHNFGRTPAILRTGRYELTALPIEPVSMFFTEDDKTGETIVGADKSSEPEEVRVYVPGITSADQASIQARTLTLYFWGEVEYADVFGYLHTTGFGVCWVDKERFWTSFGGDAFNYRKRRRDPNAK
jgi:hypothetical protein